MTQRNWKGITSKSKFALRRIVTSTSGVTILLFSFSATGSCFFCISDSESVRFDRNAYP